MVESQPSKLLVAGSIPVSRSISQRLYGQQPPKWMPWSYRSMPARLAYVHKTSSVKV